MNGFLSPAESLDNYFDELLSDDLSLSAPSLVTLTPSPKLQTAVAASSAPQTVWANGVSALEDIDRLKLEKLLRAAQSQIMPVSHATDTETKVEVAVEEKAVQRIEGRENPPLEQLVVSAEENASNVDALKEIASDLALSTTAPIAANAQAVDDLAWNANGRPEWAQAQFDVLLFDVAGLQLAVPLIALGQIQPLTDELTPLFGQADWFMGLQPTPQGHIRTVNTALFVMPERYNEKFLNTAKYVVSIDGVPWGLAVDKVNQPITLRPDDVRWRSDRTKRAWLAGTVKDHMCVLLDVARMGEILQGEDKNFAPR